MNEITLYTRPTCPYCARAKALLTELGETQWEDINLDEQPNRFNEMQARTQRRTVPQIFINGQHIGGCDDLYALHQQGKLLPLLRRS